MNYKTIDWQKRISLTKHKPESSPIQLSVNCSQPPLYTPLILYLQIVCLQLPTLLKRPGGSLIYKPLKINMKAFFFFVSNKKQFT